MSEKRIYDKNGKVIKIIFTIPVGYMTSEEEEELINKTIALYKNDNITDYWLPTSREYNRQKLLKNRKLKLNKLFNDN